MTSTTDPPVTTRPPATPLRRWRTVEQIAQAYPFTEPAIRMLIQRSRSHYNHRGEWVQGNGLADAICQPGGKHGKVLVDEIAFALWLECWAGKASDVGFTAHATAHAA
jgi:hypothetical protein